MTAQVEFPQFFDRCAGLDVHKSVVATIKINDFPDQTRTFGTFTEDLVELKNWLVSHQIKHLAMESTGVYWKPVFFEHVEKILFLSMDYFFIINSFYFLKKQ